MILTLAEYRQIASIADTTADNVTAPASITLDDDQTPTTISADAMRALLTAEGVHLESNAAKSVLNRGDVFADRTNRHYLCGDVQALTVASADGEDDPLLAAAADAYLGVPARTTGKVAQLQPVTARRPPPAAKTGATVDDFANAFIAGAPHNTTSKHLADAAADAFCGTPTEAA